MTHKDESHSEHQERKGTSPMLLLASLGLGAGATYVLDRDQGRRRRSLMTDKIRHARRDLRESIDATRHDFRNRAQGAVAETRAILRRDGAEDLVMVARVRSQLGRVASYPHGIEVLADHGLIKLSGSTFADELDSNLST